MSKFKDRSQTFAVVSNQFRAHIGGNLEDTRGAYGLFGLKLRIQGRDGRIGVGRVAAAFLVNQVNPGAEGALRGAASGAVNSIRQSESWPRRLKHWRTNYKPLSLQQTKMTLGFLAWVLCLVGGSAGIAVAYALLKAAAPLMVPYLPFTVDLHIDGRVLAFAVVAAMLVAILAGLLPARLTGTLHQSARGVTVANSLTRRMIVIGEVALSVVLLTGAALLFKSPTNLQRLDAGVRIDHMITMSTALPLAGYPKPENATTFYHGLIARLRAVPGIEQASISQDLPMQGVRGGELFYIPGREDNIVVRFKRVDPNYFSVLDIPVVIIAAVP